MTVLQENGEKELFTPEAMNSWFEKMKRLMLSNPQRMAEVEEIRRKENLNQMYMRYMNCGASKEALQRAGFNKYIAIPNDTRRTGFMQFMVDYTKVLRGEIPQINFGTVCTKSGNLLINGDAGTGKTFFALSILKVLSCTKKAPQNYLKWDCEQECYIETPLYVDDYYSCSYVKSSQMVMELTAKDYNGGDRKRICWNTYVNADFLVIDNAFGDGGYREREELKILNQIFDARLERNLPTCIITASPFIEGASWQTLLGDTLFRKIAMNSLAVDFTGCTDMRGATIQNRFMEAS